MTLLELLVQELPKRGGWPENAVFAVQDNDGLVKFGGNPASVSPGQLGDKNTWQGRWNYTSCYDLLLSDVAIDWSESKIESFEYEAALAASKQPEWNGFGLPPVGQKCQRSAFGDDWAECEVLYVGPEVIVVSVEGREKAYKNGAIKFSPMPTAADEARHAIAELCRSSASNGHSADLIYDAIAAGKIPGVKLAD